MNAGHSDPVEVLLEAGTAAFRERTATGVIQPSPAWWDLSPEQRRALFERQMTSRVVERAVDPAGLSSTAKEVLRRLPFVGIDPPR